MIALVCNLDNNDGDDDDGNLAVYLGKCAVGKCFSLSEWVNNIDFINLNVETLDSYLYKLYTQIIKPNLENRK